MTYGLQVTNASGVVTFDSRFAAGGVLVDVIEHPGGAGTTTRTYPAFPGTTADWVSMMDSAVWQGPSAVAVDYALGHPRVNITSPDIVAIGVFVR